MVGILRRAVHCSALLEAGTPAQNDSKAIIAYIASVTVQFYISLPPVPACTIVLLFHLHCLITARPLGHAMTAAEIAAKQPRVSRQEEAAVASFSFEMDAANQFQSYVQSGWPI
jgi:hypothetical protein